MTTDTSTPWPQFVSRTHGSAADYLCPVILVITTLIQRLLIPEIQFQHSNQARSTRRYSPTFHLHTLHTSLCYASIFLDDTEFYMKVVLTASVGGVLVLVVTALFLLFKVRNVVPNE